MSYEAIARKFRPQSFDQLVGQDHVSLTLLRAIQQDRIHHALLFTGPRGTGKTSSARIVAKTLRCSFAVDGHPCHACPDCLSIAQGNHVDVLELDGASNNGVDAIRQLREGVQYMASSGRYKVYIIDEVHMLSTSAFNALLKTLEEPPAHVVFIMATTEAHKVPLTILSRCQRYNFKRISTKQIANHLETICKAESVTIDEAALWLIAKMGDGSMRDAQSTLDQTITLLDRDLKYNSVVSALGLSHQVLVWDMFWAILERSTPKTAQIIYKLSSTQFEPKLFFEQLLTLIRNTLLIQADYQSAQELIDLSDSEFKLLDQASKAHLAGELHLSFDMAHKGLSDILASSEPRLVFEVILLRLASAPSFLEVHKLIAVAPQPKASITGPSKFHENLVMPQAQRQANQDPLGPLNPEKWLSFIEKVRSQDPIFAAKIEPLAIKTLSNSLVELMIPKAYSFLKSQLQSPELIAKLKQWIHQIWQLQVEVTILDLQESAQGNAVSALHVAQRKQQQADHQLLEQMLAHPKVKTASSVFNGKVKLLKTSAEKGDKT